jgi:triosephosphate isomerase
MRKKIVAGNWKMNNTLSEGINLAQEIINKNVLNKDVEIILIPPFIHLASLTELSKDSMVCIGSQNNHEQSSGAYTGEVSSSMLADLGVQYGLVGHSERRTYNNETDEQLLAKTNALLNQNITPIFCCGEHLQERKSGKHFDTVKKQLEVAFNLNEEEFKKLVIAYEPVWAIGTGETASSDQAQEIHAFIRGCITKKYSEETAENTSILYGGSCKPGNARELFAMRDVDGGLIGGASLDASDFSVIINAF